MSDTAREAGDEYALRFERRLAHPPDKVWRALTEPSHLGQWYPFQPAEMELRRGGTIRFRDTEGTELRAEITELEPPRAFAFREFDGETGAHDLRFELEPHGEGCLLIFTHTFPDASWAAQYEAGWQACLDSLTHLLAGAAPTR